MLNYQNIILVGVLMLFLALFLIFFGAIKSADKTNTKVAVGGFIGFIPFGFWSDESSKKILLWVMGIVTIIFFFLWYFLQSQK